MYAFNPTFNEKPLSDRPNYVYTIYIHTYKIFLYKFIIEKKIYNIFLMKFMNNF